MYQPKVNNTEQYSDSQGEHVVCKGKLILLKNKKPPADVYVKNRCGRHPIIISVTEEIEEGDKAYNPHSIKHKITVCSNSNRNSIQEHWNKILALPEHFSDKHLQAIVDGKMKDGDVVYLKVEAI